MEYIFYILPNEKYIKIPNNGTIQCAHVHMFVETMNILIISIIGYMLLPFLIFLWRENFLCLHTLVNIR